MDNLAEIGDLVKFNQTFDTQSFDRVPKGAIYKVVKYFPPDETNPRLIRGYYLRNLETKKVSVGYINKDVLDRIPNKEDKLRIKKYQELFE